MGPQRTLDDSFDYYVNEMRCYCGSQQVLGVGHDTPDASVFEAQHRSTCSVVVQYSKVWSGGTALPPEVIRLVRES